MCMILSRRLVFCSIHKKYLLTSVVPMFFLLSQKFLIPML
uniref:Uncharacterized protein n=1 Tax=Arundo donax TaxID=35708 RepID=A0A0A9DNS5_ARUDO